MIAAARRAFVVEVAVALLLAFNPTVPIAAGQAFADGATTIGTSRVSSETKLLFGNPFQEAEGVGFSPPRCLDVTAEMIAAVDVEVQRNTAILRNQGLLGDTATAAHPQFYWPLVTRRREPSQFDDFVVSNFVDQNPAADQILDYNGGSRTYDGHSGTDIFFWPYLWLDMSQRQTKVVAAAAGTLTAKQDGQYDKNCVMSSTAPANYAVITHADGSRSYYWHFKNGSVTKKPIGSAIAAREFLGYVGSSGSSTGPHVHFEVKDASGQRIDPFVGPHNPSTSESWWIAQRPYYDSAVHRLATGAAAPVMPACPGIETPNETRAFSPGSKVYFTTFYRTQDKAAEYAILRPDKTIYSQWSYAPPQFYPASYWYWTYNIPASEPNGSWKFRVTYNGKTYLHNFDVCSVGRPAAPTLASPVNGTAVRKRKVLLDWKSQFCVDTFQAFIRKGSATGPIVDSSLKSYSSEYTTKPLAKGTYSWQVETCNSAGCSSSAPQSFTVE